jgi:hypothetical protein
MNDERVIDEAAQQGFELEQRLCGPTTCLRTGD